MAIVINIGKLLAMHRMQSSELADKLGFTVQTMSRLKNGKVRAFRLGTLDKLCDIFHCGTGDIIEHMDDDQARSLLGDDFWQIWKEYGIDGDA